MAKILKLQDKLGMILDIKMPVELVSTGIFLFREGLFQMFT